MFDVLPSAEAGGFLPPLTTGVPSAPHRFSDVTASVSNPRSRMFRAAFTSAFAVYEHFLQTKTAWLSRFFLSTCPHRLHVWLV